MSPDVAKYVTEVPWDGNFSPKIQWNKIFYFRVAVT